MSTATVLLLVGSYVIPGLAALLTNAKWPSWVTGIISVVLSAAGSQITEAAGQPDYSWRRGLILFLLSISVALVAHKQLWEGKLANVLHRVGFTHVSDADLDVGVGFIGDHLTELLDEQETAAAVEKPRPKPGPGPLVTGTLAPPQTPAEPAPAEPQP